MAQITKVQKDFLGLYVIAGGWISRPFYETIFEENDEVKTQHFSVVSRKKQITDVGVTFPNQNFGEKGNYELWCISGIVAYEYEKTYKDEIKKQHDIYKERYNTDYEAYAKKEHNIKFKEKFNK